MKKAVLLLFISTFSLAISAQLNQHLLQEFNEFVKSQSGEYPFKQKYKHSLKMPLEQDRIPNKKTNTIQALDSIVTNTKKQHPFFGQVDKIVDLFTYDKKGKQTSATEKIYLNGTVITKNKLNL